MIAKTTSKGKLKRKRDLLKRYDTLIEDFDYEIAHMNISTDTKSSTSLGEYDSTSTWPLVIRQGVPDFVYWSKWNSMYDKEFNVKEQHVLKKLLKARAEKKKNKSVISGVDGDTCSTT